MARPTGQDDRGAALRLWGTVLLIALAGCLTAWQFVAPAPPQRLVLAAGGAQGSYSFYGRELAREMASHGLTLEVRETAGSAENIELLRAGTVDLAIVQGGLAGAADVRGDRGFELRPDGATSEEGAETETAGDELVALGSLFYEPLWIFHRADVPLESLADLAGLRVAAGRAGSGTRPIAMLLARANGVGPDDAQWIEESAAKSVSALLQGTLDVLFMVSSARSQTVRRLLDARGRGVVLFNVVRHLAYERNFRALRHVVLARGQLDFAADVPAQDVDLLAPVAMLAAGDDLHAALIPILIEAAGVVFGDGGVFAEPGEFPSPHYVDLPLSPLARRAYESGPSFLYEVLPFRLAATLSRLKIMLLPLLTLLIPLVKFAPPLYRWRIRSKVYRWYRRLRELEAQAEVAGDAEQRAAASAAVAAVEEEIAGVSIPASYMDEYYNLRMHVERLRRRIEAPGA